MTLVQYLVSDEVFNFSSINQFVCDSFVRFLILGKIIDLASVSFTSGV